MKLRSLWVVLLFQFHFVNAQGKITLPSKTFRVVIETMDSTRMIGILEEIRDSSLKMSLQSEHDSLSGEISCLNIKVIKLRRTGKVGRGALIGFGAGALTGGVMGALLHNPPEEDPLSNLADDAVTKPAAIEAGIIIGGIAGSLIGAAVGSGNSIYFINGNYKDYRLQAPEIIKLVSGLME